MNTKAIKGYDIQLVDDNCRTMHKLTPWHR
jgi:hypothetical protein